MVAVLLFGAVLGLRSLAERWIQPRGAGPQEPVPRRGRVSLAVLIGGYLVAAAATAWDLYAGEALSPLRLAVGLLLVIATGAGRGWAARELGRNYSPWIAYRSGGGLVTTGPYAFVRHPLYFLYLVEVGAFELISPNPVTLLAIGAILAAVLVRVRAEDRLLAEVHGEAFAAYRARTPALVPFVV